MDIQIPPYLKERPWLIVLLAVLAIPLAPLLIPIAVIYLIVYFVKKLFAEQQANDAAPVLTVAATVMGKRVDVSGGQSNTSTQCYALFQLEDGERVELHIPGDEYGFLAEGDQGTLTYQRKRYKGFARNA